MLKKENDMNGKNKKLSIALKQHIELLNKELSYSEDLQNKDAIARHTANIEKVKVLMQ